MSNGVGLLLGLSSSIPAPRRTERPESGSRPPTRLGDRVESRRPRTTAPATPSRSQVRVADRAGKLPKSREVVSAERREIPISPKTPASRTAPAPLSGSLGRLQVSDPSRLRLSLNPAALGEVRIDLSVRGTSLTAQVVVETDEARVLIEGRLEELRDLLQRQGFRVKGFQVELARGASTPAEEARAGGLRSHRRQVLDVRV